MKRLAAFAAVIAFTAIPLAAQEEKPEPAPVTPPTKPIPAEPAPEPKETPEEKPADPAPAAEEPAPMPADMPAEDAPQPPADSPLDLVPTTPGSLLPSTPLEPIPLIPETPDSNPRPEGSQLPKAPKKDKTALAEESLEERIRFRQARTRAAKDPRVIAEWERAQAAATDYEKREALKSYYDLFYGRVTRIDPGLKKLATVAKDRAIHRLTQTRIDPTVPLDPDERSRYNRE